MTDTYTPPASVARAARKALEARAQQAPSNRAGSRLWVSRATQLAERQPMSMQAVQQMAGFFARQSTTAAMADARKDPTSKAAQALGMCGGSAGRAWASRIIRAHKGTHNSH